MGRLDEMGEKSAEQEARDLLERCGVEDAQSFTAGDVVELANLIVELDDYRRARAKARSAPQCRTVGELVDKLLSIDGPMSAPIATLYDHGADVKFGVVVRGMHIHDADCDEFDCSVADHLVLDIDPRP